MEQMDPLSYGVGLTYRRYLPTALNQNPTVDDVKPA